MQAPRMLAIVTILSSYGLRIVVETSSQSEKMEKFYQLADVAAAAGLISCQQYLEQLPMNLITFDRR